MCGYLKQLIRAQEYDGKGLGVFLFYVVREGKDHNEVEHNKLEFVSICLM